MYQGWFYIEIKTTGGWCGWHFALRIGCRGLFLNGIAAGSFCKQFTCHIFKLGRRPWSQARAACSASVCFHSINTYKTGCHTRWFVADLALLPLFAVARSVRNCFFPGVTKSINIKNMRRNYPGYSHGRRLVLLSDINELHLNT